MPLVNLGLVSSLVRHGGHNMDFNKFTVKLQEAVETANQYAGEQNHSQQEGIVRPLIDKIGVSSSTLEAEMRKIVDSLPKAYGPVQRSLSQNAYDAFNKADKIRMDFKDEYTSAEHFLLAVMEVDCPEREVFIHLGISKEALMKALKEVRGSERITNQDPEQSFQTLKKYCKDLTSLAREGKMDPVIGRDEEIRRVMQVLCRKTKNNPVLTRCRQDGNCGRPCPAYRKRRCA